MYDGMQPVVADRIVWSVGLSVTLVGPTRCRLGWGLWA